MSCKGPEGVVYISGIPVKVHVGNSDPVKGSRWVWTLGADGTIQRVSGNTRFTDDTKVLVCPVGHTPTSDEFDNPLDGAWRGVMNESSAWGRNGRGSAIPTELLNAEGTERHAAAQTFAGTKSFADVNLSGAITGSSTASSTIAGFNAALSTVTSNITISSANAATYNGKVLVCSGSAFTVTFDSNVPVGFSCMILQSDNNVISFSGTSNRYNYSQTSGLYAIATALCFASGNILLTGDLQ